MASQTELESMVIRLLGDGSVYQKMLTDAAQQSQQTVAKLDQLTTQIQGFQHGIESFGKSAVSALAGIGVAASLTSAFSQFSDYEKQQIRFGAAVKASGESLDTALPRYQAFIDRVKEGTLASGQQVQSLLLQSINMGKTGDAVERLTKNALAFSAITGQGTETGFHLARALEQGNKEMLKHLLLGRGAKVTDTELNDIVQKRLAAGFEVMGKEVNTVSGQFEKFQQAVGLLNKGLGGVVAEALKPFVGLLTMAAKTISNLSPTMKLIIVTTLAWVAALALIPPIVTVIGILWNTFTGGSGLILGIIVTGIFSIIAGLSALAIKFGGIGAVMDWVKSKALAAWEWIKPVRQAIMSLWDEIKTEAFLAWSGVEEVVKQATVVVQQFLAAFTSNTLEEWRDDLRDAFIFAEFTIRNFADMWNFLWLGMKLSAELNSKGWEHIFEDVLPAVAIYTISVLRTVLSGVETMLERLLMAFAKAFTNLRAGIKANWSPEYIRQIFSDSVKDIDFTLPELHIPARIPGYEEERIKAEYERLGAQLGISFSAFRDAKLKEWAITHPDEEKAGEIAGSNFNKGMAKELGKLNAVLSYSAEALSQINAYRDKLVEQRTGVSGSPAASSPAAGGAPVIIPAGPGGAGGGAGNQSAPTFAQLTQAIVYLAMIANNTAKPGVPVIPFGPGGAG